MQNSPIITIVVENSVWFRIVDISDSSGSIQMELKEQFSLLAPNYKFHPMYKRKVWDGKVALYNFSTKQMYLGLLSDFYEFCIARDYRIRIKDRTQLNLFVSKDELNTDDCTILDTRIPKKYEPRDYQINAIRFMIENKRGIISSSVGSGKSLIIYLFSMWFLLKHAYTNPDFENANKILIVVPTVNLVTQMKSDFLDYANGAIDDLNDMIHGIYSGQEKLNVDKYSIVISTFQSLSTQGLPAVWFKQFGTVIVDEAHRSAIKSLTSIMEKCDNSVYRLGLSGSIDAVKNQVLTQKTLQGIFGQTFTAIRTKELQDRNELSPLSIECLILQYPKEVARTLIDQNKNVPKEKPQERYQNEVDIILSSMNRNRLIVDLCLKQLKGNTLILFRYVDRHGKILYDTFMEQQSNTHTIHFVSGSTSAQDRETIRHSVNETTNNIILASLPVFSEGINLPELHNVVFAISVKSQIKVIQSIGRGLRLAKNGQTTKVIDLIDDIVAYKKTGKGYMMDHAIQRMQYYEQEKFKYRIIKIPFTP